MDPWPLRPPDTSPSGICLQRSPRPSSSTFRPFNLLLFFSVDRSPEFSPLALAIDSIPRTYVLNKGILTLSGSLETFHSQYFPTPRLENHNIYHTLENHRRLNLVHYNTFTHTIFTHSYICLHTLLQFQFVHLPHRQLQLRRRRRLILRLVWGSEKSMINHFRYYHVQ